MKNPLSERWVINVNKEDTIIKEDNPFEKEYELCWSTGVYLDQDCQNCPHYDECSGAEDDDE